MLKREFNTVLVDLLRCPVTGEPLRYDSKDEAKSVNDRIAKLSLFDREGRLIKDRADGVLINSSGSLTYLVRQGVPLLQPHLAIQNRDIGTQFNGLPPSQSRHKMMGEIDFWHSLGFREDYSHQSRYEGILRGCFNLSHDFFADKSVLDIGCGPMGSLNSLTSARLRVGLDPLSEGYLQFLGDSSAMSYICGVAELIPMKNESCDVVVSLNSLDHVDVLEPVIDEISRITKIGGHFILFTEIHDEPTPCEPIAMDWEICSKFSKFRQVYRVESEKHENLKIIPFDHTNKTERYRCLFSILQRIS